jgi:hypothetical protein
VVGFVIRTTSTASRASARPNAKNSARGSNHLCRSRYPPPRDRERAHLGTVLQRLSELEELDDERRRSYHKPKTG